MEICKKELCYGCGLCSVICPVQCITMKSNEEGFLYPAIDDSKCVQCGKCGRVCPVQADVQFLMPEKVYAAWNKDETIRRISSSGGIFLALSKQIIGDGGYVCGAVLDMPDLRLYHVLSDDWNDVLRMKGSKYFQSTILDVFEPIKKCLKNGKRVLFTGTACQVAAIYTYLENVDTSLLYTVEVLCHGVSSGLVVKQYLKDLELKLNAKCTSMEFRDKTAEGSPRYKVTFEDGQIYYGHLPKDKFKLAFDKNLCLRNSCYNCRFANEKRIADVTIADFWGLGLVEEFSEMTQGGTSCVLVNSDKGQSLISEIEQECWFFERSYAEAKRKNQCFNEPSVYNPKRDKFFERLCKNRFDLLVTSLLSDIIIKDKICCFFRRIKSLLKRILRFG